MSRLYLLIRGYVFACGLIIAVSTFVSHFILPELFFEAAPPPFSEQLPFIVISFGYALLLLIPHRWTLHGPLFYGKLLLLLITSTYLAVISVVGFLDYLNGTKHWMIIPVSLCTMILAIGAPATLLIRRRHVAFMNL